MKLINIPLNEYYSRHILVIITILTKLFRIYNIMPTNIFQIADHVERVLLLIVVTILN